MAKTKPQEASAARESTSIKKAAMLSALESTLGVVTSAAKKVGISRETHRIWCKEDAEYAAKVAEIADVALDFAESMLHKNIERGSDASVIFYLKTKGKSRGYVERQELHVETEYSGKSEAELAEIARKKMAELGIEPNE